MKSLGELLRQTRELKGLSLRDVQRDTEISNAYLSQLETGHSSKPSPQLLHRLAVYYEFPYEQLMEAAGYLLRGDQDTQKKTLDSTLQTALMSANLNEEEEEQVADFIRFLRTQRRK